MLYWKFLLRTRGIIVENTDVVWKAVRLFKLSDTDFADCLIKCSAVDRGCEYVATFDRYAHNGCVMKLIN